MNAARGGGDGRETRKVATRSQYGQVAALEAE
jgi:hypothetical protein